MFPTPTFDLRAHALHVPSVRRALVNTPCGLSFCASGLRGCCFENCGDQKELDKEDGFDFKVFFCDEWTNEECDFHLYDANCGEQNLGQTCSTGNCTSYWFSALVLFEKSLKQRGCNNNFVVRVRWADHVSLIFPALFF